jgi:hypothetical protein
VAAVVELVVAAAEVVDVEARAVQEAGVIANGPVVPLNHRVDKARTVIVAPVVLNGSEGTKCLDNKVKKVVEVGGVADISHPGFMMDL